MKFVKQSQEISIKSSKLYCYFHIHFLCLRRKRYVPIFYIFNIYHVHTKKHFSNRFFVTIHSIKSKKLKMQIMIFYSHFFFSYRVVQKSLWCDLVEKCLRNSKMFYNRNRKRTKKYVSFFIGGLFWSPITFFYI